LFDVPFLDNEGFIKVEVLDDNDTWDAVLLDRLVSFRFAFSIFLGVSSLGWSIGNVDCLRNPGASILLIPVKAQLRNRLLHIRYLILFQFC